MNISNHFCSETPEAAPGPFSVCPDAGPAPFSVVPD
jgi:hypothetical protein